MATLRIRDWYTEYRVPRDHPDPQMLGSDCDRLAQRLADALAGNIDRLLGGNADAVLLLPSLVVDCNIDTADPPDRIAAHWSRQLTLAFACALDDPVSAMVRFPSRAAWQARFIGELVQGRGWDSWLYQRFEGLRVLPTAAAIRTLLTEDAATGRATLTLIEERAWPMLLAALSTREAVCILSHWHGQEGSRSDTQPLSSSLLERARGASTSLGAVSPALLALWLLAQDATAPVGAACWLATMLVALAAMPLETLRNMALGADLRAIADTSAFLPDGDWLELLSGTSTVERQAAVELAVVARQTASPSDSMLPAALPEDFDAPFAGLAWLLPALRDILDAKLVCALPLNPWHGEGQPLDLADCRPPDVAALLCLAIACGARSEFVWRDPFWRSFFRLPRDFDMAALHAWLAPCDPVAFGSALAASLQRLVLTDTVVLRPAIAGRTLRLAVERGSASRLHSSPVDADFPASPLPFTERLMLSRLLRKDTAFLGAGPILPALPPPWRDQFETLAQAALRRTAFRIPGAARCSLPWLFANVLNARGRARCERATPGSPGSSWQLELARPPLHVLLSLNGMARLKLAWPDSRTLVVHCEE